MCSAICDTFTFSINTDEYGDVLGQTLKNVQSPVRRTKIMNTVGSARILITETIDELSASPQINSVKVTLHCNDGTRSCFVNLGHTC